ncbi:hypothetical protein ANN_09745 [Periplaneta americana]|uniref:Tc1-like transposase DDE domain-containing protein n=1 Tax=Periplaneta americana TaxID=6978 RepID=A0ABQ8TPT1_PERAM|nr:hypothetical protein ANN_09745 [Periplaneta americana]
MDLREAGYDDRNWINLAQDRDDGGLMDWFPDGERVFMQGGTPCRKARSVTIFLAENNVAFIPWPGNSPDANPIENLWSIVKKKGDYHQGGPHRSGFILNHDGAPPHFDRRIRNHLNATFPDRWIGRSGPVPWPPRSPDLTPLDFFLWGDVKCFVYETPIDTAEDLVTHVVEAAHVIRDNVGLFERCRHSIVRRYQVCNAFNGRQFEHHI